MAPHPDPLPASQGEGGLRISPPKRWGLGIPLDMATTSPGSDGRIVLGADFAKQLEVALPRLLAPGALPDDWDPRATTYDLTRFDSDRASRRGSQPSSAARR